MKNIVIYHRADFDGIFCREIARRFVGQDAALLGWDYGDPVPLIPDGCETIYMLDISVDALMMDKRLIWIDHHKSAIDKFENGLNGGERFWTQPKIRGYRIDGVAACRLAWQWFTQSHNGQNGLAEKASFLDRVVIEPWAVRLAGEYDIWDKRDPNAELFQHGLRSQALGPNMWDILLSGPTELKDGQGGLAEVTVNALLDNGRSIQYAKTQENESIIKAAGFTIEFEGLKFLACNHARYNSSLFTAGLKPEHDGCFGFAWRDGQWNVSLYHAPGKEHHDLSQIASKYGGGGHRGACGFRVPTLPFLARYIPTPEEEARMHE